MGECLGRWATMSFSDMRNFSKIDFFDSLTVELSSNFDIWFIHSILWFDRLDSRLNVCSLRNVSHITVVILVL